MAFLLFAVLALIGAFVLVIGARSTVGAALGAFLSSLSMAGLFALFAAPFLMLTQLLLVAGAMLVGLLFVVLLVDLESSRWPARSIRRRLANGLGAVLAVSLVGFVALTLGRVQRVDAPVDGDVGGYFALSSLLLGDFAPPLLGLSLIVLVGLIGVRVLSPSEEA